MSDVAKSAGTVVIVGAGPTGLGAAYRFAEIGKPEVVVLEAQPHVGGLAASFLDEQGFTWDIGGHVQFSHYEYYDRVLARALGSKWLEHEREAWVWIAGRFVPYPFQYNLHRLPSEMRDRAVQGLEAVAQRADCEAPRDFRTWILETFGAGIAESFLLPYNFKVWGYPPEELGVGWMGERVAKPDLERVRRSIAEGRDDVSWGPNNRFRFPEQGGTGAIWKAVASLLPRDSIQLGCAVESIDPLRRTLRTQSQETLRWDALISTMPLDRLCGCIEGLPTHLVELSRRLRHSSVHILGVGLEEPQPETLAKKCWMYFPEPESPYYRVTVFSNYSPRNVPPPRPGVAPWSLMAEVCETPVKAVDSRAVLDATIRALRRDGLLAPETRIVSRWHHREPYGYPTPFLGRDEVLDELLPALARLGIYSRGRFGAWRYEVSNQDHSFMQGVEVANHLAFGAEEVTLAGRAGGS